MGPAFGGSRAFGAYLSAPMSLSRAARLTSACGFGFGRERGSHFDAAAEDWGKVCSGRLYFARARNILWRLSPGLCALPEVTPSFLMKMDEITIKNRVKSNASLTSPVRIQRRHLSLD